jgi:hypothetical protein
MNSTSSTMKNNDLQPFLASPKPSRRANAPTTQTDQRQPFTTPGRIAGLCVMGLTALALYKVITSATLPPMLLTLASSGIILAGAAVMILGARLFDRRQP